jgi:FkbM family methyltransferase
MKRWLRAWVDFVLVQPPDHVERVGTEATWNVVTAPGAFAGWVISGGAGNDISFELELIQRFGARVHLFDPSPTGAATVRRMKPAEGLWYHMCGLAGKDGEIAFGQPAEAAEGSFRAASGAEADVSFPCVRLSSWLRDRAIREISLLKIDIEGFEYEVLSDIIGAGFRPEQIAVEFHHFMLGFSRRETFEVVCLLYSVGYQLASKSRQDYLFTRINRCAGAGI